jgi:hypothetical protein
MRHEITEAMIKDWRTRDGLTCVNGEWVPALNPFRKRPGRFYKKRRTRSMKGK